MWRKLKFSHPTYEAPEFRVRFWIEVETISLKAVYFNNFFAFNGAPIYLKNIIFCHLFPHCNRHCHHNGHYVVVFCHKGFVLVVIVLVVVIVVVLVVEKAWWRAGKRLYWKSWAVKALARRVRAKGWRMPSHFEHPQLQRKRKTKIQEILSLKKKKTKQHITKSLCCTHINNLKTKNSGYWPLVVHLKSIRTAMDPW